MGKGEQKKSQREWASWNRRIRVEQRKTNEGHENDEEIKYDESIEMEIEKYYTFKRVNPILIWNP